MMVRFLVIMVRFVVIMVRFLVMLVRFLVILRIMMIMRSIMRLVMIPANGLCSWFSSWVSSREVEPEMYLVNFYPFHISLY